MTIARHLNAGFNPQTFQVPEGRPTFPNETMAMVENMRRPVSRPGGTRAGADEYPALKRRAIIGLFRWDAGGRGARRVPNAAGATGCGAGRARLGDDGNQIGVHSALHTPHSALGRLFSGIQFGMDERGN